MLDAITLSVLSVSCPPLIYVPPPSSSPSAFPVRGNGVNKIAYKADQYDGLAIYWVLLQLYHPLSRDYRRSLELKIHRFSSKFSQLEGDPSIPLVELQEKLQEAKLPQTKVLHAPNARQQHTATFPQHRCGILCSRVSMLVSAVGQKDPGP